MSPRYHRTAAAIVGALAAAGFATGDYLLAGALAFLAGAHVVALRTPRRTQ